MAGIEQIIIEMAAKNSGVCERSALLEMGVGRASISYRVQSGFLSARANGVYVVPAMADDRTNLVVALTAVPRSLASHYTAARLHGITVPKHRLPTAAEIVSPLKRSYPLAGVVIHSTRCLPNAHQTEVAGLRVTSAERTLCDVVFNQSAKGASYLVQRAIADDLIDPMRLAATHLTLARRGRNGTVFTRLLLDHLLGDEHYPRSELEIRTKQMLDEHGENGFISQYQPPWYDGVRGIVDFGDPESMTVLEVDGRRWHAIEQAQVDDRRRDRMAQRHGWRVIRFTWAEVVHDPETIVDDIRAIRQRQRSVLAA